MGDISTFVGNISKQRLARKSRYKVAIKGPGGDALPALNMMCESISFPGQNVRSVPDTLRYGPAREHAQGMTYGPFTATFICSSDLLEKIYFEDWQSQIINQTDWNVRYYDSYKGSLIITQLDVNNNPTYAIKIHEAYPKTILAQDVGYAQANAYQTIGVEFTYRYWAPVELPESGYYVPEDDPGLSAGLSDRVKRWLLERTIVRNNRRFRETFSAVPRRMPGDVQNIENRPRGSRDHYRAREKRLSRDRPFFHGGT